MNERIRDLQIQAFAECKTFEGDKVKVRTDEVFERFAELIVEECRTVVNELYQKTPLELCGPLLTADEEIAKHFYGVEESKGWVCPKCGVDRTKTVCPQGHMAAVEGKCPMIGVAQ